MFNSISGTITHKGSNSLFIENNGIEWEISVSSKALSLLPSPGNTARVLTYMNHREDNLSLFGFHDEDERFVFLELIKISGIGPKQAIKILSGISANDFISAVDGENIGILSALPGIGQKTAQKILFSLRGKIIKPGRENAFPYADIAKALSDMGFDYRKACKILSEISEEQEFAGLEENEKEKIMLKKAIIALSS